MNTVAHTKTLLKCCVIRMFAFVAMAFTFSSNAAAADYYPNMSGPYYWNNRYTGNGSIKMMPSSTHVCVLTGVGGNFRGAGESLAARVYTDGYWYLEGTATQEIWGDAVCFSRSLFKGQDNWLSSEFASSAEFDCGWGPLCVRYAPASNSTHLWWGDAVSFVNGIAGKFAGTREYVGVYQAWWDSFSNSILNVSTRAGYIGGLAYSYFVGVAHSGHKPKFVNQLGDRFSDESSYAWYAAGGYVAKGSFRIDTMAPVDKGMCYFHGISGNLIGNNFASIQKEFRNGVDHWVLKIHAPDGPISARASCFAFDQQ